MKVGGQELLLRTLQCPHLDTLLTASMYPQQSVSSLFGGSLSLVSGRDFDGWVGWGVVLGQERKLESQSLDIHGHGRPMPVANPDYTSIHTFQQFVVLLCKYRVAPFFSSLTRFYTRLISILGDDTLLFFFWPYTSKSSFYQLTYTHTLLIKVFKYFKFYSCILLFIKLNLGYQMILLPNKLSYNCCKL